MTAGFGNDDAFTIGFPVAVPVLGLACDAAGDLFAVDGTSTNAEYAPPSPDDYDSPASTGRLVRSAASGDSARSLTGVAVDGTGTIFASGSRGGSGYLEAFRGGRAVSALALPAVPAELSF